MMYEGYQCLEFERDGTVLQVYINRTDSNLNLVDETLHHDLARLFRELRQESHARAVLLMGRGDAFSAGGDFEWFRRLRSVERVSALARSAKQLIWDLLDVELPIVVAIHGVAMGLGANIALLSDVIFMAQSAQIADPHVRAGIVAGDGGVAAWPIAIGPAKAKEYLMTGDPLSSTEAERLGLVNHVVPDTELEAKSLAFAHRLAAGAPLAIQHTKASINKLIKQALNVGFDTSTAYEMLTFLSADHVEAVNAFLEKRTATFEGT